jgi:outer membrane autotransporter protein
VDFNVPAVFTNKSVDGSLDLLAFNANYRYAVHKNFFLQPFAGLTWTWTQLDDLDFAAGVFSPGSNEVGLQATYVHALSNTTFLVPFIAGSYWNNFKNETDMRITFNNVGAGAPINAHVESASSFGQLDLGLALSDTRLLTSVYVKGTLREGDVSGSSATIGGRINF